MTEFITPETGEYLALGLAAVGLLLVILVGSIVVRYRNLQQEAAIIEDLSKN